jgi:hypothetical protein
MERDDFIDTKQCSTSVCDSLPMPGQRHGSTVAAEWPAESDSAWAQWNCTVEISQGHERRARSILGIDSKSILKAMELDHVAALIAQAVLQVVQLGVKFPQGSLDQRHLPGATDMQSDWMP